MKSTKTQRVLTIGGATQDVFLHYENPELLTLQARTCLLFEQGSKIDVKTINYHTGGGATNTAVSFKRLGLTTSTIFKIGDDFQGKFILNELKKEDLDIHESYSLQNPTAISFILSTPSDRTILAFRGANKDLNEKDISEKLIINSDLIYITSLSEESSKMLYPITKLAKNKNIKTAVNPGIGQLKKDAIDDFIKSLKNIDILILNSNEAKILLTNSLQVQPDFAFTKKMVLGDKYLPELMSAFIRHGNSFLTILDYFNYIQKKGPSIAVVTNGAEGVYVAHENKIYFHESIKPEKIVNTLGAGDAFGSCFVACLLNVKSLEDSLFCGIINSSSVIGSEGAKTGLLTLQELDEKERELSQFKNVLKFDL